MYNNAESHKIIDPDVEIRKELIKISLSHLYDVVKPEEQKAAEALIRKTIEIVDTL